MLFKMTLIYGLSPENLEISVKNEDVMFSFDPFKLSALHITLNVILFAYGQIICLSRYRKAVQ